MIYCDYCEEWTESDDGRCSLCQRVIKRKKEEEINEDLDDMDSEELDWY